MKPYVRKCAVLKPCKIYTLLHELACNNRDMQAITSVIKKNFLDTRSLPHMPKFHKIVCSLALLPSNVSSGTEGRSLFGAGAGADGTKGASSRSCFAFFAGNRQKFRRRPVAWGGVDSTSRVHGR